MKNFAKISALVVFIGLFSAPAFAQQDSDKAPSRNKASVLGEKKDESECTTANDIAHGKDVDADVADDAPVKKSHARPGDK